jgi:ABC-2 type transport system ATP-binding protein
MVLENIVQVNNLSKRYGSFTALNACCLSIAEGSVFGLLGPNGAGKTTLIRCLLGYLKPTSGAATIDGLDCQRDGLQVRQRSSYLPAESKLFRLMKGLDCIRFFASIHPHGDEALALSIAKRLELDTKRRVAFMSTGMRQKLAICCVMSCQSRLMILDEPTANLDPTVRSEVLQLVREANARGTTIAFCSHVLSEIEEVCDKAAILKQGQVVKNIDLNDLKQVHRIHASISANSPLSSQPSAVRTIESSVDKIVMEVDGPLAPHLRWLADSQLTAIQVESVGLRGIYESVHPATSIAQSSP